MLVYKIIGNFNQDERLVKIFDKIKEYFYFVYADGVLHIAVANYVNREQALEVLKKTLKPAKDYFTIEITEDNLGKETPFYQDWCKENLVRIDRQRYEIENQKKLKMAMKAIDIFEEKMQESLKENDRKED